MANPLRKQRPKPAVVTIADNKQVIPGGRWSHAAMFDYIVEHGVSRYVPIAQLAKVGCGANTIHNKRRVRARLSSLFMYFIERGQFLAIEYHDPHNSASAVKLADRGKEDDRQNVVAKLERMRKRREMSDEFYQRSVALLHIFEERTQ